MVAVVDHQDLLATGGLPGVPQHVPVGVGRRERELPTGQPEALGEQGGGGRRVTGGQHVRRAAGELGTDRRDGSGGRVPDHRPGVAEAQIDVVDPVDAPEVGARCAIDEDRPGARPLLHPEHRHAVRHVLARLEPGPLGLGASGAIGGELVAPQRGQPFPILVHVAPPQPSRASLRRRAAALS